MYVRRAWSAFRISLLSVCVRSGRCGPLSFIAYTAATAPPMWVRRVGAVARYLSFIALIVARALSMLVRKRWSQRSCNHFSQIGCKDVCNQFLHKRKHRLQRIAMSGMGDCLDHVCSLSNDTNTFLMYAPMQIIVSVASHTLSYARLTHKSAVHTINYIGDYITSISLRGTFRSATARSTSRERA